MIGFRVLSEVESAVEIVHLTVADSYKNQGHEMSLVESIIKRIRRRGYKTIVTLLGGGLDENLLNKYGFKKYVLSGQKLSTVGEDRYYAHKKHNTSVWFSTL